MDEVGKEAGPGNVETTVGYVGTQAASYPINTVFLWTSGPQEAVFSVQLRPEAEMEGVTADSVINAILAHVPVPR